MVAPSGRGLAKYIIPNPYDDANADVQVLERVRETWARDPAGYFGEFVTALGKLADARWRADRSGPSSISPQFCRVLYFRTGDYARAALHVLNTENAG